MNASARAKKLLTIAVASAALLAGNPVQAEMLRDYRFLGITKEHITNVAASVFVYQDKCPGADKPWATDVLNFYRKLIPANEAMLGLALNNSYQKYNELGPQRYCEIIQKLHDDAGKGAH
jgi:hypothetical protein